MSGGAQTSPAPHPTATQSNVLHGTKINSDEAEKPWFKVVSMLSGKLCLMTLSFIPNRRCAEPQEH